MSRKINIHLAVVLVLSTVIFSPQSLHAQTPEKVALCIACHGTDGYSSIPGYPHLAGQWAVYTAKALRDYRDKKRPNVIMQGIAQQLSDDDIEQLADYYEFIND